MIEEGGDWDRRNRLKVYEAVFLMSIRQYGRAAELLLDTLSTFVSYELFDYDTFVFYAVITSIASLPRPKLKQKVVDAPDILSVIHRMPILSTLLNSFYNSEYKEFFVALAQVADRVQADRLTAPHAVYFCREMRIRAYSQLLESYRSVQMSLMARQFGVSEAFLDRELSRFIASGRLHCKIDQVAGIVETTRPDAKNAQYQAAIKQGDLLLNRIQKLSRVINI
jgi:26S proteasome regulatory subunit N7